MNERQLVAYLDAQGIEYTITSRGLRVMDASQLPASRRDLIDDRGYFKGGDMEDKEKEEALLEAAKEKTKELDAAMPMGETEKEMTVVGLLNPDGDTKVPAHLESHEPKASPLIAEEIEEGEEGGTRLRGTLPDDFPGKAALEAEGYTTYAKVRKLRAAGELTTIKGIGTATAAAIDEVFAGEDA